MFSACGFGVQGLGVGKSLCRLGLPTEEPPQAVCEVSDSLTFLRSVGRCPHIEVAISSLL